MQKFVNLEKFANGALTEKFNKAYKKVIENINDPNTPDEAKRKLIVTLEFAPDVDREVVEVNFNVTTKLASEKTVGTKILIGLDGEGGVVASEFKKQIQGQTYMKINEEDNSTEDEKNKLEGIKVLNGGASYGNN